MTSGADSVPTPKTDDPVLSVSNLSVSIRLKEGTVLQAVRDVSLSIGHGETVSIVGESGSGKSITAASLMRLLPHRATLTADQINFMGRDLSSLTEKEMSGIRGPQISMIFQDPINALNPAYTIGNQLIETYRQHRKATRAAARRRAAEMLERVGVPAVGTRLRQYPHQLSGGLCQRVMIAMALICEPTLLIADEPTTALDVTTQAQILALLGELQRDLKMALLLISHDLGVVSRLADRISVMYAGEFVEEGDRYSVLNHPSHPYTRALLDCIPTPDKTRLGAIRGVARTVTAPVQGCAFGDRCDFHSHICDREVPMRRLSDHHTSRCARTPGELEKMAEA